MKLRGTSQSSDQVTTDAIVLSFFEDERPLKGPTGLADWHLCGRLSRLIIQKFVDGAFGEPLLMPATHRMPCEKVVVLGLGKKGAFNLDKYRTIVGQMCDALIKMRVNHFALALPGVALTELDPAEAASILGNVIASRFGTAPDLLADLDVTVFAERRNLKAINPVLARLERSVG
jgi:Cytosol aminopeptidase family, N-terminal domain